MRVHLGANDACASAHAHTHVRAAGNRVDVAHSASRCCPARRADDGGKAQETGRMDPTVAKGVNILKARTSKLAHAHTRALSSGADLTPRSLARAVAPRAERHGPSAGR